METCPQCGQLLPDAVNFCPNCGTPLRTNTGDTTRVIPITQIGDARTLAEATRFRGGLVSTIEGERVRGQVQVVELAEVAIDAVRTPSEPRFVRPA